MEYFLNSHNAVLVLVPHLVINSVKLIFLFKKKTLKQFFINIYFSTILTIFVLLTFKKESLKDIDSKNHKAIKYYHNSILVTSIFFSILLIPFSFGYSIKQTISFSWKKLFLYILSTVGVYCAIVFNQLYKFSFDSWGKVDFDQILFNLRNPTKDESSLRFFKIFMKNYAKPAMDESKYILIFLLLNTPFTISFDSDLPFIFHEKKEGDSYINITIYLLVSILFLTKMIYTINDFEIFTIKEYFTIVRVRISTIEAAKNGN